MTPQSRVTIDGEGVVLVGGDLSWPTAVNDRQQGVEVATALMPFLVKGQLWNVRFTVDVRDPGVFVYVDGHEVTYWDTTDVSHAYQGAEVADALRVYLEEGVDAALAHSNWPLWRAVGEPRRWKDRHAWPGLFAARRSPLMRA